jgi:hypothetical protein
MWLRAVLAFAVVAVAATAPAAGAPDAGRTLRYRLAGEAWNLGRSDACHDGSVRYGIRSPAGRAMGTATICVLSASRSDAVTVTEHVVETDAFAAGWLRTRATQVYRNEPDGKRATVSIRGAVKGGTGRYKRARGTVTGAGTRRGDVLDVRVTVRLT